MDTKSRNVWIIVAAILVVACCCTLALATGAASWIAARATEFKSFDLNSFDLGGLYRERIEETFDSERAQTLEIDLFAGSVTVRPGGSDEIHIVAVKKAPSRTGLDRIEVKMTGQGDRVLIRTKKSGNLSNSSVDLEITAPASTSLEVNTGAGTVDVRGIDGGIDVHSGAGTIEARDVSGTARIGLGAGEIIYEGSPAGSCRFETGVGSILVRLPGDSDLEVDVGTGLGSINVDFDLDGRVTSRHAEGVIGDGSQGSIYAHTGAGNVTLDRE